MAWGDGGDSDGGFGDGDGGFGGDSGGFGNDSGGWGDGGYGLGFGHESFGLGPSGGYSGPGTMGGYGDYSSASDVGPSASDTTAGFGGTNPWGGYDFNASPTQDTLSLAAPPVNLSNLIGAPVANFTGMPGFMDTDMGTPTSTYGFNTYGIGGWAPSEQTAANPGFLSGYSTNPTAADTSYSYGVNPASQFSNVLGNMSGLMGPQKSPSVQGWGDMSFGQLDPTKNPALRYSDMPTTSEIANTLRSRYENSPLTQAASYMKAFAPVAGFFGPLAGGLVGLTGQAAETASRSYYGQNASGAPLGGTVGGMLGSAAGGPLGGLIGRVAGNYAGGQVTGDPNAGEQAGQTAARGIGGMAINSMTQGMGPVGGLVGSLLGRGLNAAMGSEAGSPNTGYANSIGQGLGALATNYLANRQQRQAANQQSQLASEMMGRVDPFGTQRAQYGQQLQQLTQNPEQALMSNPILAAGYRQALQQGNRAMAASGNLGSGARVAALAQLAPAYLGNIYNQEAGRLANLAGANISNPQAIQNALMAQGRSQDMQQQAKMQYQQNLMRMLFGGPQGGYGTYAENFYG